MFNQQKGVLILAVAIGLIAIILVQTYASRVKEESEFAKGEMTMVLTVTEDVAQGAPLTEENIREMQVPKKWRNPTALGPEDKELILGMQTAIPLARINESRGLIWDSRRGERQALGRRQAR